MKRLLLAWCVSSLVTSSASAGNESRGGYMLLCDSSSGRSKWELLDYFELTTRRFGKLNPKMQASRSVQDNVLSVIGEMKDIDPIRTARIKEEALKILESLKDPQDSYAQINNVKHPSPENGSKVIDELNIDIEPPPGCRFYPLVKRKPDPMEYEAKYEFTPDWDDPELNNVQKAGLILHEAIYWDATQSFKQCYANHGKLELKACSVPFGYGHSDAKLVRYFTGEISSTRMIDITVLKYTGLLEIADMLGSKSGKDKILYSANEHFVDTVVVNGLHYARPRRVLLSGMEVFQGILLDIDVNGAPKDRIFKYKYGVLNGVANTVKLAGDQLVEAFFDSPLTLSIGGKQVKVGPGFIQFYPQGTVQKIFLEPLQKLSESVPVLHVQNQDVIFRKTVTFHPNETPTSGEVFGDYIFNQANRKRVRLQGYWNVSFDENGFLSKYQVGNLMLRWENSLKIKSFEETVKGKFLHLDQTYVDASQKALKACEEWMTKQRFPSLYYCTQPKESNKAGLYYDSCDDSDGRNVTCTASGFMHWRTELVFLDRDDLNCIAYDRGRDALQAACQSSEMTEAADEGYRIFSAESTDYENGCLILERLSNVDMRLHSVQDNSSFCTEALDEGDIVWGEAAGF